jgi:hypothetical protein
MPSAIWPLLLSGFRWKKRHGNGSADPQDEGVAEGKNIRDVSPARTVDRQRRTRLKRLGVLEAITIRRIDEALKISLGLNKF